MTRPKYWWDVDSWNGTVSKHKLDKDEHFKILPPTEGTKFTRIGVGLDHWGTSPRHYGFIKRVDALEFGILSNEARIKWSKKMIKRLKKRKTK